MNAAADPRGRGLLAAAFCYALWGVLPLYFVALEPTPALEIIAWRIVLSAALCLVIVAIARGFGRVREVLRNRRLTLMLGLAGVTILVNWSVYVIAVLSGHALEGALGYYLNPLVSVALGALVLGERLRKLQAVAIGVAALAVIVLIVGYGRPPWYSIVLALSFGLYGLIKKQVSREVDALTGFTVETCWLLIPAIIALIVMATAGSGLTFGQFGSLHTVLLASAGVVTSVPLLLFASASRRLTLIELGTLQYIAPTLQFMIGMFVLREPMPVERWLGFAFVWVALILLTIDLAGGARRRRRVVVEPLP